MIKKIKKLWHWLPIIWKDEDWDYVYFLEIMRHKLISMRGFFNSDQTVTLYSKNRAEEMEICIKILNRLIADEYHINTHIFHNKKWGDIEIDFISINDKYNEMVSNRKKVKTEKDKEQEKKEFLKCMEQGEYLKKQDIQYLGKLLTRHLRKWWD